MNARRLGFNETTSVLEDGESERCFLGNFYLGIPLFWKESEQVQVQAEMGKILFSGLTLLLLP